MERPIIVSPKIVNAFFLEEPNNIQKLGGNINLTFLAELTAGGKFILQQLSPIFPAEVVLDYGVVAEYLQGEGWEVASPVRTTAGNLYEKDELGRVWRTFKYIDSDSEPLKAGALPLYGKLLGGLHLSLAGLDYKPLFTLPHFHEIKHYAAVLRREQVNLPRAAARQLAGELLSAYKKLPELPPSNVQLIHGDPKADNILSRQGKPFTFIDWDTLMIGTIWMDIGDMVRSLAVNYLKAGQEIPTGALLEVIETYRQTARPGYSARDFRKAALDAAQIISLGLAMRFAADYQAGEAGYFVWDDSIFSSRHEHNLSRAHQQREVFKYFQSQAE